MLMTELGCYRNKLVDNVHRMEVTECKPEEKRESM